MSAPTAIHGTDTDVPTNPADMPNTTRQDPVTADVYSLDAGRLLVSLPKLSGKTSTYEGVIRDETRPDDLHVVEALISRMQTLQSALTAATNGERSFRAKNDELTTRNDELAAKLGEAEEAKDEVNRLQRQLILQRSMAAVGRLLVRQGIIPGTPIQKYFSLYRGHGQRSAANGWLFDYVTDGPADNLSVVLTVLRTDNQNTTGLRPRSFKIGSDGFMTRESREAFVLHLQNMTREEYVLRFGDDDVNEVYGPVTAQPNDSSYGGPHHQMDDPGFDGACLHDCDRDSDCPIKAMFPGNDEASPIADGQHHLVIRVYAPRQD